MAKVRKRVDLKVIASTIGGLGAGLLLATLEALVSQPALLEGLSPWLRFLVIAAGPGLIVFLSGCVPPSKEESKDSVKARHARREDTAEGGEG